jgi:2-phospho-L-lactate guanylyltransferase
MRVVVPFATERPKTRLDGVLSAVERAAFSRAMLADVLEALDETGHEPEVLATAPLDNSSVEANPSRPPEAGSPGTAPSFPSLALPASVPVRIDERALTPAINAVLESADEPVAVVMADLALATPAALDEFFATAGEVVLTPGRGGGTNALCVRHSEFRVDYHGTSYLDHLACVREIGAEVGTIDSFRLATDVDEPADLTEVLLHSERRATRWLRAAGFSLAVTDGRVGVGRSSG